MPTSSLGPPAPVILGDRPAGAFWKPLARRVLVEITEIYMEPPKSLKKGWFGLDVPTLRKSFSLLICFWNCKRSHLTINQCVLCRFMSSDASHCFACYTSKLPTFVL